MQLFSALNKNIVDQIVDQF